MPGQQRLTIATDPGGKHIDRLAWRIGFGNTAKLSILGIALAVGGYLAGQYQASGGETAIRERASFGAQIMALNDPNALREACMKSQRTVAGGVACDLPPVWVRRVAR